MIKKVAIAGVIGWLVLAVWTFVVNGIFGFNMRMRMKSIENERGVYEILKSSITRPGGYICNPKLDSTGFPGNEPIFSIQYSGLGHESAGAETYVHFAIGLVMAFVAAGLLSVTSERVLCSYFRRLLFVIAIALFLVLFSLGTDSGLAGYPPRDALVLAAESFIGWSLVGLVLAARVKPSVTA